MDLSSVAIHSRLKQPRFDGCLHWLSGKFLVSRCVVSSTFLPSTFLPMEKRIATQHSRTAGKQRGSATVRFPTF